MGNFSFWGLCVICSSSFIVSVYIAVVIFRVNESVEDMSSYIPPAMTVSMVSMKDGAIQWEGSVAHISWVLVKSKLTYRL